MSLPLLAGGVLVLLGLGYRFYGGFIARQYQLDPAAKTPAERLEDGVDFVPTKPFYLLGQHFAAIAAAGPIAGPILAAQLGRYTLQELFGWRGRFGSFAATFITCAVPLGFVLLAGTGAWRAFWTLFGTSNQLLASLSLMGITVWLKRSGRRYWYALFPMLFVTTVTVSSLVLQIHGGLVREGASAVQRINGGVSLVLLGLAAAVAFFCVRALRRLGPPMAAGTGAGR